MKNIKVLIAPNSFKECADSTEVASLIENSLQNILPVSDKTKIQFFTKPISDGGDGFLNVCTENLKLGNLQYEISTPYDDSKLKCEVGYSPSLEKIYIESANVLGLKLIPETKRKPLQLSSKGMGELLNQIVSDIDNERISVKEVVIGIGGTGTNDLALGLMQTFGLKLIDANGREMDVLPANFNNTAELEWRKPDLPFSITSIIDVDNILVGEFGATKVFGPQKGATPEIVEFIENGFLNILKLIGKSNYGEKFISGAGGGLAAGLDLFLDADYKFSKDFVREDLGISSNENYDLIISGEGSFDSQSMMNKGTMIIVNEFKNKNVPVFLICGQVKDDLKLESNVKIIELVNFFSSPHESIKNIKKGIQLACRKITEQFNFV
ncbi:glycerate kinase [Bacteroidota bacterium]